MTEGYLFPPSPLLFFTLDVVTSRVSASGDFPGNWDVFSFFLFCARNYTETGGAGYNRKQNKRVMEVTLSDRFFSSWVSVRSNQYLQEILPSSVPPRLCGTLFLSVPVNRMTVSLPLVTISFIGLVLFPESTQAIPNLFSKQTVVPPLVVISLFNPVETSVRYPPVSTVLFLMPWFGFFYSFLRVLFWHSRRRRFLQWRGSKTDTPTCHSVISFLSCTPGRIQWIVTRFNGWVYDSLRVHDPLWRAFG